MSTSPFLALLSRMKYITRWGLMRSTQPENLSEHTLDVAYITHVLCLLSGLDPARAVFCALYHDCSEILTGDLPTPVKYHDEHLRKSYKELERVANVRLLETLPPELAEQYRSCFFEEDPQILRLVKAADKLSALTKCIQEVENGNNEFLNARDAQLKALHALELPCVEDFLRRFMPPYSMSLDEISLGGTL